MISRLVLARVLKIWPNSLKLYILGNKLVWRRRAMTARNPHF